MCTIFSWEELQAILNIDPFIEIEIAFEIVIEIETDFDFDSDFNDSSRKVNNTFFYHSRSKSKIQTVEEQRPPP